MRTGDSLSVLQDAKRMCFVGKMSDDKWKEWKRRNEFWAGQCEYRYTGVASLQVRIKMNSVTR